MTNSFSTGIIQKRAKKYIGLKKFNKKSKTNLIYEFNITKYEQIKLQNQCFKFIKDNFKKHKIKATNKSREYLLKNLDSLHTYTHNGALKPKKETIESYKKIVCLLINFLEKKFSNSKIKSITLPNVRIIRDNKKLNNHKLGDKDTRILHTDIWVGQTGSGIFNMGIYGDFKNSSVKYYDIFKFKKNYLKKYKKFQDAQKNIIKKKYFTKLKIGKAVYFDLLVPHNTFTRKNGKNRVSIDFCISLENKIKKNSDFCYFDLNKLKYNLRNKEIYCRSSILDAKKGIHFFNDGILFKKNSS